MDQSSLLYEDQWGEIIDRPSADLLEVRWYDTTADMTAQQFQDWLSTFASFVELQHRRRALVDSTSFLMDRANMDNDWRDANILPRYHAAGVLKFAFHMPAGMPAIGDTPAKEGSADFPTGYFGRRQDALDWLAT